MNAVITVLVLVLILACPALAVSWEFNTEGNTQGWWVGNSITGFTATGGCLVGDVSGCDPFIIGVPSPKINADATPYIQVRMKVSMGYVGEFFWLTSAENFWHPSRQVHFPIIADNEFHDYVVDMSSNPNWQGQIDALRFDMTEACNGRFEIDYIRVLASGHPVLEASDPSIANRFAFVGEQVEVSTVIRNTGASTATNVQASLTVAGQTLITPQAQNVGSINPGEEREVAWQVMADSEQISAINLSVTLDSPGVGTGRKSSLVVSRNRSSLPSDAPSDARAWVDDEQNAVIENGLVRMAFIGSSYGYAVGALFIRNGADWDLVAASAPLSRVGYMRPNKAFGTVELVPASVTTTSTPEGARLQFAFTATDADSGVWQGHITYTLGDEDDIIKAHFSLESSQTRDLTEWVGPSLSFGNRSTGNIKNQALFPGLEWLESDEPSSSTMAAHPPLDLRVIPHAYKITVPLMAVSAEGNLVAILWDSLQSWSAGEAYPSAKFSSPNWYERQDNHLMELFLPSMPSYVQENMYRAGIPYVLAPGHQINMEGHYLARRGGEVLDAIDEWYSMFGTSSLPGEEGILQSGLEDSRTSLMTHLWNASNKGWPPVIGWTAAPYTEYTTDLFAHALSEQDSAVKASMLSRANEALQQAISWWGQAGIARQGGSYASGYRIPYFGGYLNRLPETMLSDANNLRNSQQPDGGWFVQTTEWSVPGTKELGSCAENAYKLLRHARVTGNPNSKNAGLNALDFMDSFVVPRGGQVWEVPQHAPDILPAAHAVAAYLEGYKITGNPHHLEMARYWARAGLPFVYLWRAEDREIMDYATIPVFGATHYTAPWFGRPVQWCGMVYAFYVERLADYDDSMPWRTIAEGITRSCIQQMRISPIEGTFPDVVSLVTNNVPGSPWINPDIIYKMTLQLLGKWHEIDVRTIAGPATTAHISTGGRILSGWYNTSGNQLSFRVNYPASETCNILVFGTGSPTAVYKDGMLLTKYTNVNSVSEGWSYNTTSNFVVIKGIHGADQHTYHIMTSGVPDPINPVDSPAQARGLPDGSLVSLTGVVSAGTSDFGRDIYVQSEDRSSGIRVSIASEPVPVLVRGDIVEVVGSMFTSSGKRYIAGADVRRIGVSDAGDVEPLSMANRSLGGADTGLQQGIVGSYDLTNIGLLIKTWGTVTQVGDGYLYIDDGSGLRDGTFTGAEENIGVRVVCDSSGYQAGDFLIVTGISSCFETPNGFARRILPRNAWDIARADYS